jgi:hypothetical protein
MASNGIYSLDIKKGKFNLGALPNIIVGKHIHGINYNLVLKEMEQEMDKKEENRQFLQSVYNFYGHKSLLARLFERIDELKNDDEFTPPMADYLQKVETIVSKMNDINYIPSEKNKYEKIILNQIDKWLMEDYEPDYDPYYE